MHGQYHDSVAVPRRLREVPHSERGEKPGRVRGRPGVAAATRLQGEALLPTATQGERE